MPRIVAKLLLSMLVVPLSAFVYALVATFCIEWYFSWPNELKGSIAAGIVTWLVVAAYWLALWRRSVDWTVHRFYRTVCSAGFCLGAGAALANVLHNLWGPVMSVAVGTGASLFGWLGWTVFIWQKPPASGSRSNAGMVVCPSCGYDLRGLRITTCPECGESPTLERLFSGQPGQDGAALERPDTSGPADVL